MVEQQPFTTDDLCYSANDFRLMQGGLVCAEGVSFAGSLMTLQTTPASGSVQVQAGSAFISNDNGAGGDANDGGYYHVFNDGIATLPVPLNSSGGDRTDIVWAQVCDSEYAAVTSGFTLVYDDDNPTATPPADGCTYYRLATLVIPNGAGTGGTNVTGIPTYIGDTAGMITYSASLFQACGDNGGWVEDQVTLDFPSIGAGLAQTLTMTVRGASVGDPVAVGTTIGAFSSQLIWSAYVSATDTVTCRVFNPTGGALDPPASTWTVAVKIR